MNRPDLASGVVDLFRSTMHLPDPSIVYAVLGAVAANRLPGDPLWLLLVGPPSSGKTETLDALCELPEYHPVSTFSEAGLLAGSISKDSGATWQNFKTLELQQGMQDIDRIPLEFPISRRLVARPGIGQLPDGFAMFTYSNVDIIGEKVFVRYVRMWPRVLDGQASHRDTNLPLMWPKWEEREAEMTGEGVLRVYPLAWFYQ